MGLRKHLDFHGAICLGVKALKVPFQVKLTKILKVKTSQNHPKNTIFMFLHQTRATQWFSLTLTKFDLKLTLKGPKNPNFDLTVKMG